MKNLFTLRFMLISLFAAMSMVMNAEIVQYDTDEGFGYQLDTETKTAALVQCLNASIEVVTVPASVTYEGASFTVTSLGQDCFWGHYCLTSITIPSSVTSLGKGCFHHCSSLTSITIPSSVKSLGDVCFGGCSSLASITIPSSVTSLGDGCFENCSSLTSITIPSSVTSLGYSCFRCCSSLTSITIPSSVTDLGKECFAFCSSLTSITIPSSVTSLGYGCFWGCSSLKTVTCEIPTAIEGNFFYDSYTREATLYVPEASLASYKTTRPWSSFGTILPIESSGIESNTISTVADVEAVYGLDGKRCNSMKRGINIIRMSDGTTRKIVK